MNKKQQTIDKILSLISKMEVNSFLFPRGWSDNICMLSHEWKYKTYNSGSTGKDRYHNVVITYPDNSMLEITFRRDNKIFVNQDLSKRSVSVSDILFYIQEIFDEKHSFANHVDGIKKLRDTLSSKQSTLLNINEDIILIKQQIEDLKVLNNETK